MIIPEVHNPENDYWKICERLVKAKSVQELAGIIESEGLGPMPERNLQQFDTTKHRRDMVAKNYYFSFKFPMLAPPELTHASLHDLSGQVVMATASQEP